MAQGGTIVQIQGYQPVAVAQAAITATGAQAAVSAVGLNVATITLRTFTGTTPSVTWKLQASDDNTNWVDLRGVNNTTSEQGVSWTQSAALSAGTAGPSIDYAIGAYTQVRVNVTAISGTSATAAFGVALQSMPYEPSPSVVITPTTAGGFSTYHLVSAATTNATVVKASAGQLYGWYIYNNATSMRKLAFHNTASAPTAGASIFFTLNIPASSGANVFNDTGIPFSTGIAFTTVTDVTDAGTTAVSLSDLTINLFYK